MSLTRLALGALAVLLAATAAHAQIAFRGAASAAIPSAGLAYGGAGAVAVVNGCPRTINPALPAGTVAGDMLIALVSSKDSNAITMAGWNTLFAQNPVGNFQSRIFWRIATGANPNAIDKAAGAGCNVMIGRIARFTGVDTVSPFESVFGAANWSYQNSGTVTTGTENTVNPSALLVLAAHTGDNSNLTSTPAGFTLQWESLTGTGSDVSVALLTRLETTAGAKGPFSMTKSRGADPNHGVLFALRPAGLRIAVPAGTAVNDVMIASIAARPCSGASGAACTTTIAPPAGWTLVNSFNQTTGGGTGGFGNILYVYRRVAGAADIVPGTTYAWTFGGTPVNAGAAGAITSFSGVDIANPVVVSAGQVTPSAYTHTAPSVNTGAVTNTMLVSSHAANSAASWTPPPGMTEAADRSSLAVPNDLGISLEVNYEPRAAAGATGARTATHSNPPTSDTGAAHMLALRPAVTLSHYAISVLSTSVANCSFAEVTITGHNAGHAAVNPPATRVVTLSTSVGTGVWQPALVAGTGVWTPSGLNNGLATYQWTGGESSFTVRLVQSAAVSLSVNLSDGFVLEDPTEDPTITFTTSALRITNGANAGLVVGNQIASKPSNTGVGSQSLFLQAIQTVGGACSSLFPAGQEVDFEVGAQCNNPAACTQNVTLTTSASTGSPTGTFVPNGAFPAIIRFRFTTANAEAPFFFSYADAGQITLQFRRLLSPGVYVSGTSNPFVTRPFGFAFRGANAATPIQHGTLPTSALLSAAGDNFTMTLAAYRWNAAEDDGTGNPLPGADITNNGLTPNFASAATVSASGSLPGIAIGAVSRAAGCTGAATIAAGSWSGGAATVADWCYSEAGNAFFNAAAVDYLAPGVNIAGNSGLDGTGAAGGFVGRFKPKHFAVSGVPALTNRSALACAPASSFTYLNEGLSLGFTLEARNTQDAVTQNYTGAYAKLNLTTAASLNIGASSGATNLTSRVDASVPPIGGFANGVADLVVTTGIRRATPDAPDGPYAAAQFGVAPNDNDPNAATGVQMNAFDLDVDGVGGDDHAAVGAPTELRYGRLWLQNAYGSGITTLPVPIEAQYWNGSAFAVNALDSCTVLPRSAIAQAFTAPLAPCNTAVNAASVPFSAGLGSLVLSAPGAGSSGSVLLTPNLGTAGGSYCNPGSFVAAGSAPLSYLLGRWDDAANPDADGTTAYDDKPNARAAFGLYGSQPKSFIFYRENY